MERRTKGTINKVALMNAISQIVPVIDRDEVIEVVDLLHLKLSIDFQDSVKGTIDEVDKVVAGVVEKGVNLVEVVEVNAVVVVETGLSQDNLIREAEKKTVVMLEMEEERMQFFPTRRPRETKVLKIKTTDRKMKTAKQIWIIKSMVRDIMKDMITVLGMDGTMAAGIMPILTVMQVMIPVIGVLVIKSAGVVEEDEGVVVEEEEGEVIVVKHSKVTPLLRQILMVKQLMMQ
jgi:hypothetical protein